MKYKEAIRFSRLAQLHGFDAESLLKKCQRAGIAVLSNRSTVFPSQRTAIEALIDRGNADPPLAPVPKPTPPKPKSLRAKAKLKAPRRRVLN